MIKKIFKYIIIPIILLFVGAFLGIIGNYFNSELSTTLDKVFGESRIIVNFTAFHPLALEEPYYLEKFNITFATARGKGWIVLLQKGNEELNKEFGLTTFYEGIQTDNTFTEYAIDIKNTGRRSGKNTEIKFEGNDIDINKPSLVNIDFANCDGFDKISCVIKINRLPSGEIAGLLIRAKYSDIRNIECNDNNNRYQCITNYRDFYVMDFFQDINLDFDNKVIKEIKSFPPLNPSDNLQTYLYRLSEGEWGLLD